MNILQLVTRNELRGAEVFAGQLSQALVGRGHELTMAGLYALREDSTPLNLSGVTLIELGGQVQGRIERRPLLALARLIRKGRFDVIQANGFHALKYACLLKKMRWTRQPILYRNISVASAWASRPLKRAWGRWLCKSLAAVSSVSQSAADDFAEFYRFPAERIQVIRRGIEVPGEIDRDGARHQLLRLIGRAPSPEFTPPLEESASEGHLEELATGRRERAQSPSPSLQLDSPRGRVSEWTEIPLLCHVGGLTPEKNHSGLLTAFAKIHAACPDAELFLFGDGPLRGDIESIAQGSPQAQQIHFMGFRDDARDLVAGCDLMLLASRIEGIPGVVLEAAARNVPSVSTDVGGVGEFIQEGETGCLVDGGDMESLAEKAIKLLNDRATRERLGRTAHQRVREEYNMERAVDQFERLYGRVIGQL